MRLSFPSFHVKIRLAALLRSFEVEILEVEAEVSRRENGPQGHPARLVFKPLLEAHEGIGMQAAVSPSHNGDVASIGRECAFESVVRLNSRP
jgi:hypothetical protein